MATSQSPSSSSRGARTRRFETMSAGRPSTAHGSMAGARSWRSSASLGTRRACTSTDGHDCPALPSGCAEAPSWAHADHGFSAARQTNGGQSPWDEAERTQRTPHGATQRLAIAHPQDFRTESARAHPTRRGGHVGCRRRTRGLVCDSSRLRLAAPAAPHAAATASDCLAIFTTTLCKPSRFLMAREGAPCWAPLHSANSVQSPHAVAPRRRPRRGRCCLLCH